VPESPEELAYDASLRALDRQRDALSALRTRAGTLLAAAALVASFAGAAALQSSDTLSTAGGIVGLAGVLVMTLAILWPYQLTFRLSAKTLLEDHAGPTPTPMPTMLAVLAIFLERHHDDNERTITRLHACLQVASGFLALETIAWLTAV
jgi:hypothetical protein